MKGARVWEGEFLRGFNGFLRRLSLAGGWVHPPERFVDTYHGRHVDDDAIDAEAAVAVQATGSAVDPMAGPASAASSVDLSGSRFGGGGLCGTSLP